MPEPTAAKQIERAVFELRHNAQTFLAGHSRPEVRRCHLDPRKLDAALRQACEVLHGYERLHAGLRAAAAVPYGGGTKETTDVAT